MSDQHDFNFHFKKRQYCIQFLCRNAIKKEVSRMTHFQEKMVLNPSSPKTAKASLQACCEVS